MYINAHFRTYRELCDYFRDLKNIVPSRKEKKYEERQIKAEIFCIEKYLTTLAHIDLLTYPLNLVQQTRTQVPDFIINEVHGIEVTEATDEDYQKWLVSISRKSGAHMYNQIGYFGDNPEKMAAQKILTSLERKQLKIDGYQKSAILLKSFDLLIYENTEYIIETEELFDMLLKEKVGKGSAFGKVSIICGGALFYAINTNVAQCLEIPILIEN